MSLPRSLIPLRTRGLRYADVARRLGLSVREAKRLIARWPHVCPPARFGHRTVRFHPDHVAALVAHVEAAAYGKKSGVRSQKPGGRR